MLERDRGFHSRDGLGACASCHPDHAGRDFDLIKWPDGGADRFRHETTGWPLEGKHTEVKCASCHKRENQRDVAASLSPRDGGPRWVGLEQRCVSCHVDPHRSSLGDRCTSCHEMSGWKPAGLFDHDRARYALTGRHQQVACADCHTAPRLKPRADSSGALIPVFRPVPFNDCSSCHTDPHQGRLTGKCSSCHVTTSFRTVQRGAFAHDRTRFPLLGRHADVACAKCHVGYPRTISRPAFATCGTCHRDPHAGQATVAGRSVDCAACHRVEGFTPSTFTVAQHAASRFPLRGRHAVARCGDCHRARQTAGAQLVADLRPDASTCVSCHRPVHGAQFAGAVGAVACESCHDVTGWKPPILDVAAHTRFGYPLEGAHRAVACVDCHSDMRRPATTRTTLRVAVAPGDTTSIRFRAARSCASCHRAPHGAQFASRKDGGACESCHTVAAFAPAARFNHDRDTRFALAPAHAKVPCASCHLRADPTRPDSPVIYRGTVVRCSQCHAGGRS